MNILSADQIFSELNMQCLPTFEHTLHGLRVLAYLSIIDLVDFIQQPLRTISAPRVNVEIAVAVVENEIRVLIKIMQIRSGVLKTWADKCRGLSILGHPVYWNRANRKAFVYK